jgi:hypothetical protein
VRLLCVCVALCVVAAFRRSDHSSMESFRLRTKDNETDEARAQERAVEPLMNELTFYRQR